MIEKGFANVPLDTPELGIEFNEEAVKVMMSDKGEKFFDPTPEWDRSGMSYYKLWI